MRHVLAALLLMFAMAPARAQIPKEWEAAAPAVIGELERSTPLEAKPWTTEIRAGWNLARQWRQHNNGNVEITLAEYLTFTALCRDPGCGGSTIAGKPYTVMAQEMKKLRAEQGDSYPLVANVHAWLAKLDDPTGAAAKDAALWSKDPDKAASDKEMADLYALYWILARSAGTPADQAATFTHFALFVQEKGWIGTRCLDIAKVATVIDAPPKVETCQ
ncbi:MAG TPA: hypothetical protein VMI56_09955 [Reyranella sp.]|nr:hypothetical protein [Reyranella sp.]